MSRKSGKSGSSGGGGKSSGEQIVDVDPTTIYFTFSRIRPCFSCGRTIESTTEQMTKCELKPTDLPLLAVFTDGKHLYSQNNRRLYMYKQLKARGILQTVPVRLRPLPSTRRMATKYTPDKCALEATLMGEAAAAQLPPEVEDGEGDEIQSNASSEDGAGRAAPAPASAAPVAKEDGSKKKKKKKGRKGGEESEEEAGARGQTLSLEEELRALGLQ